MKTPVALVTAALTAAILLAASFLIATGTRGEGALPSSRQPCAACADIAGFEVRSDRATLRFREVQAASGGTRAFITTICEK